jgi:hypothetical protein
MTYHRVLFALILGLAPAAAVPQTLTPPPAEEPSHWGVSASFTPTWKIPSAISSKIVDKGGALTVQGPEFTVGFVHGRSTGGDWGISYVRESIKDGSTGHDSKQNCFSNGCLDASTFATTQNVRLSGVEAHIFLPFGLIKERVQIGINLGGGAAKISGNLLETEHKVNTTFNPQTGQVTGTPTTVMSTKLVTDEISIKTAPMAHIGVVVAVLARPDPKIRWEGGVVLPGQPCSD